jgi:hypothetical protein
LGWLHLYEVSRDPVGRAVFETLLATEHYLGYRSPIGENSNLLCIEPDRPVAAWRRRSLAVSQGTWIVNDRAAAGSIG